jgi:hypothetical protein
MDLWIIRPASLGSAIEQALDILSACSSTVPGRKMSSGEASTYVEPQPEP